LVTNPQAAPVLAILSDGVSRTVGRESEQHEDHEQSCARIATHFRGSCATEERCATIMMCAIGCMITVRVRSLFTINRPRGPPGPCDMRVHTGSTVTVTRKAVHARAASHPGKAAPLMPSEPAIPVRSLPCTPLAWAHSARGPPFCVFYVCRRRSLSCCFSVACCLRRSTLLLECMHYWNACIIGMHALLECFSALAATCVER
jgi:hypothetical protein